MAEEPTSNRQAALEQLVSLAVAPRVARAALAQFEWDSDTELVQVVASDASRVLSRIVEGTLSLPEASEWAEALDARDDVGYEQPLREELRRFVFELSSPEISGAGSPSWLSEWTNLLR